MTGAPTLQKAQEIAWGPKQARTGTLTVNGIRVNYIMIMQNCFGLTFLRKDQGEMPLVLLS